MNKLSDFIDLVGLKILQSVEFKFKDDEIILYFTNDNQDTFKWSIRAGGYAPLLPGFELIGDIRRMIGKRCYPHTSVRKKYFKFQSITLELFDPGKDTSFAFTFYQNEPFLFLDSSQQNISLH